MRTTTVSAETREDRMRLLMNPSGGSVDTEENWRADFARMSPEEWGGDAFEDADLIEVEPDGDGWWKEVGK